MSDDVATATSRSSQQKFILATLRRARTLACVLDGSNYTAILNIRLLNKSVNALVVALDDYWTDKINRCVHQVADVDADKYADSAAANDDDDGWIDVKKSSGGKRDRLAKERKDKIKKDVLDNDPMVARKKRFIVFKMIEQTFKSASVLDARTATPFERFATMMVAYNLYSSAEGDAQRTTYKRSKQLPVVDLDAIAFYTVHRYSETGVVDMNEGYEVADDADDATREDDGCTHRIVLRIVKKPLNCVVVVPLYAYASPEAYKSSIERNKCLYAEKCDAIASFEFAAAGHRHSDAVMDYGSESAFRDTIKYFVRIDAADADNERLLEFPYNIIKLRNAALGFATVVESADARTLQAQKRATERDFHDDAKTRRAKKKNKKNTGRHDYLLVDRNCYANTVRFAEYTPPKVVNVDHFWHAMAMLVYDEELDAKHRMAFPNRDNLCVLVDRYSGNGGGGGGGGAPMRRKLISGLLGMANTGHLFDVQRDRRVNNIGDFGAYQLVVKSIVSTDSDMYTSVNRFNDGKAAVERCLRQADTNRRYFRELVAQLPDNSELRSQLAATLDALTGARDDAFDTPYTRLLASFHEHESGVFASFIE